tara:strand:+ start:305 stop:484 length:180 start_codon:yes stop_codon:yes gene_type:complete
MQIEEIKHVFTSVGKRVTDDNSEGYYKVDGGKSRSERSLMREAKSIVKQQQKAAKKREV